MHIGKTYKGDIIPSRTRWIYCTSGIGRDALYAIVATFLLIFVKEAGYLPSDQAQYNAMFGVITALIIGYRFFDAVNDPFMGVIVEKAHLKTGKYKPWIFIGCLTNTITVLALFLGPKLFPALRNWGFVAWFAVFYLLWGMTFTMNDIAFCSMMPSLSSNEKQRAKITSTLMIFENGGSFLTGLLIPYLSKPSLLGSNAYWVAAVVICGLFVLGQTCLFLFCQEHERDLKAEKNSRPPKFSDMINIFKNNDLVRLMVIVVFVWFISLGCLEALLQDRFYLDVGYVAGKDLMSAMSIVKVIAIVIPMLFMPTILNKVNKMKVFRVAIISMLASYALFFFYGLPVGNSHLSPNPNNQIAYAVVMFIIVVIMYISNSCTYTVIYLLLENTIEYNEYISGDRREGLIFSFRPFATKLASSLEQGITTVALLSSGSIAISNKINDINAQIEAKKITEEVGTKQIEEFIKKSLSNNHSMSFVLRLWEVLLPMLLLGLILVLISRYYHLTDYGYRYCIDEIKKRNK